MAGLRAMYREHLEALADDHGAELDFFEPASWMEYRARLWHGGNRRPLVEAPTPVNRERYMSGLHEFGHLEMLDALGIGGTSAARTPTGEGLHGELLAWLWAFDNAKVPATPRDAVRVLDLLCYEAARAGVRGANGDPIMGTHLVPLEYRASYENGLDRLRVLHGGER
ncbi:MAG: hypothetical protein ACLP1Q_21305 [Solirubrobacteraceae bacterium]